jgi:cytochrome c553
MISLTCVKAVFRPHSILQAGGCEMFEVTRRSIALGGALVLASATSVVPAEPVGPKLTPKLLDTLRQEMASVLLASQDIVGALAIGDHGTVAERAQQVDDSFILEQSLTEQDREDLETALPPEFVELDRGFHETSAALAAAAHAEDVEQELDAFARMTEACVVCHGRFAADRFPSLARE